MAICEVTINVSSSRSIPIAMTIAVFCTSKRLEHEIGYLADIAEKVYLIPMYKNVEIERDNITKIIIIGITAACHHKILPNHHARFITIIVKTILFISM